MKKLLITVIVLNMHAGWDASKGSNLGRVAAFIRDVRADVVLLQEVDRGTARSHKVDQPSVLERLTGMSAAFGRTLDYDGGQYGIAILVRGVVEEHALVPLPVEPAQVRAGGSREPRGALVANVVLASGQRLRILNTHLDASRDEAYRLQETERLLATIADQRPDVPVLVGGDFNATPDSATYARVQHTGLADAWKTCGAGPGLTYPADTPVKRIDYLFLSPALACDAAEVPAFQGSDHRPLVVRIRLR